MEKNMMMKLLSSLTNITPKKREEDSRDTNYCKYHKSPF